MTISKSMRNIAAAGSALAFLGLSACAAQHGNSRYGDCAQPCIPSYQQSYVQSYYHVPVQAPAPTALPTPVIYSAPSYPIPPAAITCPADTLQQDNGTCLQVERPVYVPPVTGYTLDPITPPQSYKPIRK